MIQRMKNPKGIVKERDDDDTEMTQPRLRGQIVFSVAAVLLATAAGAQTQSATTTDDKTAKPAEVYKPFRASMPHLSILRPTPARTSTSSPAASSPPNHPIPSDQPEVDQFYALYNVNTQSLNGILTKAAAGGSSRTPNEQKIGDYYKSCMDDGRHRSQRPGSPAAAAG